MTNHRMQNPDHLRDVVYKDASKLNARIEFWRLYGRTQDEESGEFFDEIEAPSNAAVLDIGCGPAHYWQWGLDNDRVPRNWSPTLTDLSNGMLEEAKRNTSGHDHKFVFEIADVCDLQYEDELFDVVTANYMLYHAASQHKALAEISRVLKPGGKLYAKTHSVEHIAEFFDLQKRFAVEVTGLANTGLSYSPFTLENGGPMIEEHFSSVRVVVDKQICKATDPQVVIDYARSMSVELHKEPLAEFVTAQIKRRGHFTVTRSSGMFVAQK